MVGKIKFILLVLLSFQIVGCNSSTNLVSEDVGLVYTASDLIEYNCNIKADGINSCWVSKYCVGDEKFSGRAVIEVSEGEWTFIGTVSDGSSCNKVPKAISKVSSTYYFFDSVVTSSEGVETELYQIGDGFSLIHVEDTVMCFSEGYYTTVNNSNGFATIKKQNTSNKIDFNNCFERI